MEIAERQNKIMKMLRHRGYETVRNLAFEFGVSERTIRRDIVALSITQPIYTQTGRYGGGVYMADFDLMSKTYMSDEEIIVLQKICRLLKNQEICILSKDELNILESIVTRYSRPISKKGNKK